MDIDVRRRFDQLVSYASNGPPIKITRSIFHFILAVSALAFLSVFLYGTFYYTFVPKNVMRTQLHFQRAWVVKERGLEDGSISKVSTQTLHVELPLPTDGSSFLSPGQLYSISVEFHLADSEVNHNAGTFLISAHYYDKVGKLLTTSSRLIMLKYRSWLVRTMTTLAYSPLYLIGFLDEVQVRRVELFKDYNENAYRPTALVVLDVDNPNLQFYQAEIVLQAQFSGLKYYMYYWPISTALVAVSVIFTLLFTILFCSWLTSADRPQPVHSDRYESVIKPADPASPAAAQIPHREHPLVLAADDRPTKRAGARSSAQGDNTTEPVTVLGVTDLDSKDTRRNTDIPTIRQRKLDPAGDNVAELSS